MFHALHYSAIFHFFVRLHTSTEVNLLFTFPVKLLTSLRIKKELFCKIQNIIISLSIICGFL